MAIVVNSTSFILNTEVTQISCGCALLAFVLGFDMDVVVCSETSKHLVFWGYYIDCEISWASDFSCKLFSLFSFFVLSFSGIFVGSGHEPIIAAWERRRLRRI